MGRQEELSEELSLYEAALSLIAKKQAASTSFLQVNLNVGYTKATELMNRLEENGVVGAADGIHKRMILINADGSKREM